MNNEILFKGIDGCLEKKFSAKGFPYWDWRRRVPGIPEFYLHTIVYIYKDEADARAGEKQGGCGFLIGVQSETVKDGFHAYIVTNRHVSIRPNISNPCIRVNTKSGELDYINTEKEKWIPHPDGDDLAVYPLVGIKGDPWKVSFLKMHIHPIDDEYIKSRDIRVGSEVFMVGRFINYEGVEQNKPLVRFGNISMMPPVPVYDEFTKIDQESYLVEMRSIPGYSGSPVVVYTNPFMPSMNNPPKINFNNLVLETKLLGINWGHIIDNFPVLEKEGSKNNEGLNININTNMAAVVPVQKLIELLNIEELVNIRKEIDEIAQKKLNNLGVVPDSIDDGEGQVSKEEFENALEKAFKPDEEQTSGEEKS